MSVGTLVPSWNKNHDYGAWFSFLFQLRGYETDIVWPVKLLYSINRNKDIFFMGLKRYYSY